MFTLFTVRVLRASTHLQSLVHFLGIYQFDLVTLSLVYFLSGPTKYLKIFSLQMFLALKFSNISHEFQSLRSLAGLPTLAPSVLFICKISKLSQRGAQYRLPSNTQSQNGKNIQDRQFCFSRKAVYIVLCTSHLHTANLSYDI